MALYIPHGIFRLARLLYVRPETFGPYYVGLHGRRPIFLPDCNPIWIFLSRFHKSPQYQISREPRMEGRT